MEKHWKKYDRNGNPVDDLRAIRESFLSLERSLEIALTEIQELKSAEIKVGIGSCKETVGECGIDMSDAPLYYIDRLRFTCDPGQVMHSFRFVRACGGRSGYDGGPGGLRIVATCCNVYADTVNVSSE